MNLFRLFPKHSNRQDLSGMSPEDWDDFFLGREDATRKRRARYTSNNFYMDGYDKQKERMVIQKERQARREMQAQMRKLTCLA